MQYISKMTNILMLSGKKLKAEKILKKSFEIIHNRYKKDPTLTFNKAVENVKPSFEMRSIRVAGRTQQIPFPMKENKQIGLALKWIVAAVKGTNKSQIFESLAFEIHEASMGKGSAIKKRDLLHKSAESNRAFAHFRWS